MDGAHPSDGAEGSSLKGDAGGQPMRTAPLARMYAAPRCASAYVPAGQGSAQPQLRRPSQRKLAGAKGCDEACTAKKLPSSTH